MGTVRDFRREQIIQAARALVSEGGLRALTYARLEKRLSFTRGVITHHFKDRDDIVQGVLRSALREIDLEPSASETDAPEERIRRTLRQMVDGFLSHPQSTRILVASLGEAAHHPEVARLLARWRQQAAEILRDGVARGALRYHDTEAMAAVIVGQIVGAVMQDQFEPDALSVGRVVAASTEALLAALRA